MELWTFDRYRRPRLCVDAIDLESEGDVIRLRSNGSVYRFAVDDPHAARRLADDLATLQRPDAPLWEELRSSGLGSAWREIGTFLDAHSLLCEAGDEPAEALAAQERRIATLIDETAAAAVARIHPGRRAAAARRAARLFSALANPRRTGSGARARAFQAAVEPDFFEALLAIELDYLKVASPLGLATVEAMLARIAGKTIADRTETWRAVSAEVAGLHDDRDLAAHLWLVAHCLAEAGGETAARLPTPSPPPPSLCSGLEFMRRVEMMARDVLSLWGPNPFAVAVRQADGAAGPLLVGPYIEQYHVSRRLVEMLAPLLSRRLAAPPRAIIYQYYSEEVGHEVLEGATCEALGVSRRALDLAIPLPLNFAFVDVLTQVARIDPVAAFASILVVEGMFGAPASLPGRLAAAGTRPPAMIEAGADHDELNETHNHTSIGRNLFVHLPAVSIERQAAAIHRILFLLELNHRAWSGIAQFYGGQDRLALPGPAGSTIDPLT